MNGRFRRGRGTAPPPAVSPGREKAWRFSHVPATTERARRLRRDSTDPEKKLWQALRRDQLNGLNFRRQHLISKYVLDFYCPAARLAVEVDGGQHAEATKPHDELRNRTSAAEGIAVVRFWNNDVLRNREGVLTQLASILERRLTPARRAARVDLPLSGEGKGNVS